MRLQVSSATREVTSDPSQNHVISETGGYYAGRGTGVPLWGVCFEPRVLTNQERSQQFHAFPRTQHNRPKIALHAHVGRDSHCLAKQPNSGWAEKRLKSQAATFTHWCAGTFFGSHHHNTAHRAARPNPRRRGCPASAAQRCQNPLRAVPLHVASKSRVCPDFSTFF